MFSTACQVKPSGNTRCRAGTESPWSFGDIADFESEGRKHAIWSDGGKKFDKPQPVARHLPNAFGLYDMHGNMWEYVADWWHRLAYKEAGLNDPTGPALQAKRTISDESFAAAHSIGDAGVATPPIECESRNDPINIPT